jgi:hypothetical protein
MSNEYCFYASSKYSKMPRRKKSNGSQRTAHYFELRRHDEMSGGDHSIDIIAAAARAHNKDLLRYLARQMDINYTEEHKTALFWLAGEDDPLALECLILAGGMIGGALLPGAPTPLMHAAFRNRLENIRLLVKYGADVEYCDAHGQSALSLAEMQGHTEIVDYLKRILSTKA